MADFFLYAPLLEQFEGGYVFDSEDPGGATNKGITFSTYKRWCRSVGRPQPTLRDLQHLSHEEWLHIVKELYWDHLDLDALRNIYVASQYCDFYFNAGYRALMLMLRLLHINSLTFSKPKFYSNIINNENQKLLFSQFVAGRLEYYRELAGYRPVLQKYHKGWQNRTLAIRWGITFGPVKDYGGSLPKIIK